MYRRLSSSLPQDPVFPADLKELGCVSQLSLCGYIHPGMMRCEDARVNFFPERVGFVDSYFVNDQDEVKSIADPTKDFTYYINKNERYNERQREAMNSMFVPARSLIRDEAFSDTGGLHVIPACIRQLVLQRLDDLGIRTLPLPIGTPSDKAHIPILASSNLPEKKRIILVFNEVMQDLGIWSYRTISRGGAGAISRGSAVELAKRLHGYATSPSDQSSPGLVIANPGQLLWWRGGKKAVSFVTWHSLPRKSAVHGPMRIDEVKNRVPGNEDWEKHVQYMFNEVMAKVTDEDVLIDVVGLSDGGYEALKFLNENCKLLLRPALEHVDRLQR